MALAKEELGDDRVIAGVDVPFDRLRKEDGIVVVHPEADLDVDSFAAFMREGGRVVLLDDFGTGDVLLKHFGLERVPMTKHPTEFLRENPAFALAEPSAGHPVVKDVHRVVVNHATGVRHAELSPVLVVRSADAADVLLAEAGAVGKGRLLAVGDGSVVMNSMLRFPGNRAFAVGIVHYATEDDAWGKRGGRLYVVSGPVKQTGTYGDAAPSRLLRDRLRSARSFVATARKEGLPAPALFVLVVILGLALVGWVGSRAGRIHARSTPRFAKGTPLVAQGGVAGHAAVLASPVASRALALLEIKSAMEEALAARLGRAPPLPLEALVVEGGRKGLLKADDVARIRRLLLRMADVESHMISRKVDGLGKVREGEVLEAVALLRKVDALSAEALASVDLSALPLEDGRRPAGVFDRGPVDRGLGAWAGDAASSLPRMAAGSEGGDFAATVVDRAPPVEDASSALRPGEGPERHDA